MKALLIIFGALFFLAWVLTWLITIEQREYDKELKRFMDSLPKTRKQK